MYERMVLSIMDPDALIFCEENELMKRPKMDIEQKVIIFHATCGRTFIKLHSTEKSKNKISENMKQNVIYV